MQPLESVDLESRAVTERAARRHADLVEQVVGLHALAAAYLMADGDELDTRDFFFLSAKPASEKTQSSTTLNLDDMERNTIQRAIDKNGGNISKAAKELGLTRASLYRRLEKYGL